MPLIKPMHRGESTVALVGLAMAVILVTVTAVSVWWASKSQRDVERKLTLERTGIEGTVLSTAIEAMLSSGDASSVRRLVIEAAREHDLNSARVVLSNGSVIADADPSLITVHILPEVWEGLDTPPTSSNQSKMSFALRVPGRGTGTLELAPPSEASTVDAWESYAGIAGIGAVGLLALLVTYRLTRRRLRALGSIRESLLALSEGETSEGVLTVADALGSEAKAWNELLRESARLRDALSSRTLARAASDRGRGSDLTGVCDAMWQGVVFVDETLTILYANGASSALLGQDPEKTATGQLEDVVHADSVIQLVRRTIGEPVHGWRAIEVQQSNANATLRFSVRRLRKSDTASAIIVIEDLSQQRVAEEARHTFVAQAAHELRMPLTNIRLYTEMALEQGDDDPEVRANCLNVINTESRRLERIVNDMLSVAEIEAGSMDLGVDDVRLDAMMKEVFTDFRAQAEEKRIQFDLSLAPKLPVLQGDRDKIALALHNVIGNALKYTPEDGRVTIAADVDDEGVVITVSDSGIGIGIEDQSKIFDQFYRANDTRLADIPGSGLGLALAREIVRRHGGDVTVESVVDKGSTFTVRLPEQRRIAA